MTVRMKRLRNRCGSGRALELRVHEVGWVNPLQKKPTAVRKKLGALDPFRQYSVVLRWRTLPLGLESHTAPTEFCIAKRIGPQQSTGEKLGGR